jgi:phosphoribosylformylglycinamidine synthase II
MVAFEEGEVDAVGEGVKGKIENFLGMDVDSVQSRRIYTVDAKLSEEELNLLKRDLFVDPINERLSEETDGFDWLIEVGYKPGVTDNVGQTTKNAAIPAVIKRRLGEDEGVYTSTQYLIKGDLAKEDAERIGLGLLANPIIESINVMSREEVNKEGIPYNLPVITGEQQVIVKPFDLDVDDDELMKISREGVLALNLNEMRTIREDFKKPDVYAGRMESGIGEPFYDKPTDAEMEALAQTWSEHCKHKTFNALIRYVDEETGKEIVIDSLFDTFIKNPSNRIADRFGWVASSFHDNAGAIRFNDRLLVVDKIETHNSPSVKDPFGGAITGIVGVNRDPMGTGKGAKLMFNIFGYCFGSPFYDGELQEGVLHPNRVRDGVHSGVIAGGNQSGIPLISGWEFFDPRYNPRVLVYCGTIGKMLAEINGEPTELKKADSGDAIVMVGGRVGKDGIHGATFSSAELDRESPAQAVQIGDPITQKKMSDFLEEARNLGLYKCITDNGAGGLSSSVGEMARFSNGCKFNLEKVPLKYQGLEPWEILLSEAQERMTVAVHPDKLGQFLELAERRDVEATALGKFEDSGKFHVTYGDRTVAYLDMKFLHEGMPQPELEARWKPPKHEESDLDQPCDLEEVFEHMLARINICSKENKIRQYDHEVKGLSVVKPLVGKDRDVPSDATVSFLEYGSTEGLAVAAGVNPHYSDIDAYHMTASIIDEAIRRIIAVGGKLPSKDVPFYALDNFCWNISDPDTDHFELAQLVRANMALADYCEAFEVPCISGKDSMRNVWKVKETGELIRIPPTLLFSARAKIGDVSKVVTMDVKRPGDLVYVVGTTKEEMGGSEYYSYLGERLFGERYIGNSVPTVDAESAKETYRSMSEATERGLVHSIHTPTIGGLGIALAKSAFAGGYGMDVDLRKVPYESEGEKKRNDYVLFSQSNSRFVVTVPPENKEEFEEVMGGNVYAHIGEVTEENRLKIMGLHDVYETDMALGHLKEVWKGTLGDM